MFHQKLYLEETLMGQLNNLVLCYGVMCILTRKYQGIFAAALRMVLKIC